MENYEGFIYTNEPLKAQPYLPGDYIHLEEDQVEVMKKYYDIEKISDTSYRNYLVIDVRK